MKSLDAAVADALSDHGPLARELDGFEARPGQRAMAAAVGRVLESGGVLLAEAGTGTGKTLAYLVPAILHRRRALVSTGTKNLQEQIVQKDVPLLQQALDVRFTATCMKGRANYLCLHRFELVRSRPVPLAPDDRRVLTLVEAWLEGTETGDRAELDEVPEDLPLWGDINASAETCLGSDCPRFSECFVTRMRQRAAESDLVVVNHHLLCADAAVRHQSFGEVIPECSVAVIDEAHQLEDVATQYFGLAVSNYRIEDLLRDAARVLPSPGVTDRQHVESARRALSHLEQRSRTFFDDLQRQSRAPGTNAAGGGLPVSRHARSAEAFALHPRSEPRASSPEARGSGLFDERRRITPQDLESVAESGLAVIGALDEIEAAVGLMPSAGEDLRAVARRAVELRDTLRFLLLASDPAFVYFFEVRGRGLYLRAMPIDVSSIVRELLFDRMQATVLTSATLAVNGRFDYIRQRLGIADADEIRLPSEFDYARQSVLYLPRRMPDPRTPAFADRAAEEVLEILNRTEGRAFVLFTSYATLRQVERRLEGRLPYPVLVQGEAPRSILLAEFKRTPNSVLLATSSFWQGVDVAGEALSCVIIDKLPFASPGDPIVQARIEAITAQGGDAFGEYQVPLAILTLLQGLGRLLRHRSDRGVLAILDPRLRSMGYGRRFLASLPPAPVTHDLADIARFFDASDRR